MFVSLLNDIHVLREGLQLSDLSFRDCSIHDGLEELNPGLNVIAFSQEWAHIQLVGYKEDLAY